MSTGSFSEVKPSGRGVDHPPPSSGVLKEKVELYFYSPSGPSWPVVLRTLPLSLPLPLLLYIYIYIHTNTHTHTHTQKCGPQRNPWWIMWPSCVLKMASPVLVIPTPAALCIKHLIFTPLTSLLLRYNQKDNSRILGTFRQSDTVKRLYFETVGDVFLSQLDHS